MWVRIDEIEEGFVLNTKKHIWNRWEKAVDDNNEAIVFDSEKELMTYLAENKLGDEDKEDYDEQS